MAHFHISLTNREIAGQIAEMVNLYNLWAMHFPADSIMASPSRYFVEIYGNKVVGCAGIIRDYPTLSKIQHICVLPEFRRREIAYKLTNMAIRSCETEYIYMTIREDNTASLSLSRSLGFRMVEKNWFRDHWTFVLSRRKDGKVKTKTNLEGANANVRRL